MKQLTSQAFARNQGDATVLDVREPDEFAMGHIPGAVNLPLSAFNTLAPQLNREIPYALICATGNRSAMATEVLDRAGFDVTNLVGGMAAWPLSTTTD